MIIIQRYETVSYIVISQLSIFEHGLFAYGKISTAQYNIVD